MRKLIIILICFSIPTIVFAQGNRVALVIGNSIYENGAPLANSENDAKDIAEKLKACGFDVSCFIDLSQTGMRKAIDEFGVKLDKADVGLFFYAGHGVQAKGRNYLLPVDASLKTENDVEYNCVDAGRILSKMEDAHTNTNIIILDACRDNPFERSWSRSSNGNGLAYMDAPGGSLIAYSTAPGKTASDGYSRNSPFTSGLLAYMDTPNLTIEALFKLVRIKVMENTDGQQVPWEASSLTGDFYFNADQHRSQTKLADILPSYKEKLAKLPDYESLRQTQAAKIRSIAVMPFANYTGDDSKAYLASGMQDALISELGKLGSLRVISKTSTLQYADFGKSIKEVATELNVDGIIETSLIDLGDSLRIQLKLYSSEPEEEMLWTNVFTSGINDILNLYNRVIKDIAEEIQLTLTPDQMNELAVARKIDAKAYLNYLQGRFYWSDIRKESLFKARDYLNEGIKLVDDWAPLYAGLTQVWVGLAQTGYEPQEIAGPKIMEYMAKALELDPEFPDIHFILGIVNVWQAWDWLAGEKSFLKAITINPNDAMARMYYAHLLSILNRNDEAILQAELAAELDPFNPLILTLQSAFYSVVKLYDKGIAAGDKALSLTNYEDLLSHGNRDIAALAFGDYDKAWESFSFYLRNVVGYTEKELNALGEDIKKDGYIKVQNRILAHIEERNKSEMVMSIGELAIRHSWSNNKDKTLELLETGFEAHDPNMPYISTWMFNLDLLRDSPRYKEIAEKMKLPIKE